MGNGEVKVISRKSDDQRHKVQVGIEFTDCLRTVENSSGSPLLPPKQLIHRRFELSVALNTVGDTVRISCSAISCPAAIGSILNAETPVRHELFSPRSGTPPRAARPTIHATTLQPHFTLSDTPQGNPD